MRTNHELIKIRREELAITQEELGSRVGHGKAMVSLIENGKVQLVLEKLTLYAKALGLPEQKLVIFEN